MTSDTGFAPNPFWGYCTLAACTPNHQRARLQEGDWLVGNSSAEAGRQVVYAMRISEILDYDDYYRDRRFAAKKAKARNWRRRCGDNIYRKQHGKWAQATAYFHLKREQIKQDTRNPQVFVSDHFFYFGEKAKDMPRQFRRLLRTGQGIKYHEGRIVAAFVEWLERRFRPGVRGLPRDRKVESHDCVYRS